MASYLLGAVALLAATATGALGMWLLVGHRLEALRAYVRASHLDHSPERLEIVDDHLAGWRAAPWRWIHDHLPHRRAAA